MTYESKQKKAQEKANKTGRQTCIFEDYGGYHVGFLTSKTVGSAQEVFEPVSNYTVHHEVVAQLLTEEGMSWSRALAFCNID